MQSPKKIAVAGATGRVGHHVVNVLKAGGPTPCRCHGHWAWT